MRLLKTVNLINLIIHDFYSYLFNMFVILRVIFSQLNNCMSICNTCTSYIFLIHENWVGVLVSVRIRCQAKQGQTLTNRQHWLILTVNTRTIAKVSLLIFLQLQEKTHLVTKQHLSFFNEMIQRN